jgi:hypothetical protein
MCSVRASSGDEAAPARFRHEGVSVTCRDCGRPTTLRIRPGRRSRRREYCGRCNGVRWPRAWERQAHRNGRLLNAIKSQQPVRGLRRDVSPRRDGVRPSP